MNLPSRGGHAKNGSKILVVVPSISAGNVLRAGPWLRAFHKLGAEIIVVANNITVARLAREPFYDQLNAGANEGFAASINKAAETAPDWDWLVMLNDDLNPSTDTVKKIIDCLHAGTDKANSLILFDPERSMPIPSALQVFTNLSLLNRLGSRRRSVNEGHRPPNTHDTKLLSPVQRGHYKSFSAAAISRHSWTVVGPLDDSMPFCYEDADYVSRYVKRVGAQPTFLPLNIDHGHSMSTKANIDIVLPVVTYSGMQYLAKQGVRTVFAKALVILSLAIRLLFVPASRAPKMAHLRGTLTSIRSTFLGTRPTLPAFDRDVA